MASECRCAMLEVFLSLRRGPGRIAKVGMLGLAVVRGWRLASRYAPVAVGLACIVVHVFQCRSWVLCCGSRGYIGWRMPGESKAYK